MSPGIWHNPADVSFLGNCEERQQRTRLQEHDLAFADNVLEDVLSADTRASGHQDPAEVVDVKAEPVAFVPSSVGIDLHSEFRSSGCTGNFAGCKCGCQGGNSYGCCGQSVTSTADMNGFLQLQSCTCTHCGKSFHNSSNLRRHRRIHFNDFNHQCAVCGRKFYRSDMHKRHMKIVHGLKI